MHARIRSVAAVLVLALVAVFGMLNYVQIFAADSIAGNNANIRSLLAEYSIKRGDILTTDLKTVATSEETNDRLKFLRLYPEGALYGHITGHYSVVFGETRIEESFNDQLLGESSVLTIQDIEDRFLGSGREGDDVRLTIDSELQSAARDALGDNEGAVVAIDPRTGRVRAMWANPSYDPGPLATHRPKKIRAFWKSLSPRSPTSPLVPKATSRRFPPGSTFKVVTAAAALASGRFDTSSTFPDPVELDLPLTDATISNFSGGTCTGVGEISLFEALRVSCNTTFAQIGLRVPGEIHDMAEALGFNDATPFDVSAAESSFPDIPDEEEPARAQAAIGQRDVAATPLQMALIAATIANDGRMPRPRLVQEVIDPSGAVVERFPPEVLDEAMPPPVADTLTQMMVAVVDGGTGTAAQIPGLEVAGKTGTAQTGIEGAPPHAWFIAFAPADNPRLAVAVLVENGGSLGSEATGGAVAAPIAKAVLEADRSIRGW